MERLEESEMESPERRSGGRDWKSLWFNEKGMVRSLADVFGMPVAPARRAVDYEIPRKLFHMLGALVPLIYYFGGLTRAQAVWALFPFAVGIVGADLLRMRVPAWNQWYMKRFGRLMRAHESRDLTTSTYFLIATFLVVLLFPRNIAVVSILFLSFGDPAAALIGRRFGEVKILGKSLEGFLGCFQVCFFVALPFLPPHHALIGALTAALAELLPLPLNDNIRIPVLSAIVLSLLV
jgi:dolichol kinase